MYFPSRKLTVLARYSMFGKREEVTCTYLPGLRDQFIDYQSPAVTPDGASA